MLDNLTQIIFGRLTPADFVHDPIMAGAGYALIAGLILTVIGLTYFKKWTWLWRTWLTSLDPKKIGVMYLIVAVVMLLRGFADVLMMRAQQALSSGDSHGVLSADTFQQVFSAHGTIMIFFVAMGM